MTWPVSINAAAFPGAMRGRLNYREAMQFAADLEFSGFELLLCETGTPSFESSPQELAEVSRTSSDTIPVTGISTLLNWKYPLASQDQAVRSEANRLLRVLLTTASQIGCDTVTLSAGDLCVPRQKIPTLDKPAAFDLVASRFREHAKFAADHGVQICVENVLSGFIESHHELKKLVEQIEMPNVSVCLDIGNSQKYHPAADWIAALGNQIVRAHVTDYQNDNDQIVPAGEGYVDWPSVQTALQQLDRDVLLVTEHYFNPSQPLRFQLQALRERVIRAIPNLKSINLNR